VRLGCSPLEVAAVEVHDQRRRERVQRRVDGRHCCSEHRRDEQAGDADWQLVGDEERQDAVWLHVRGQAFGCSRVESEEEDTEQERRRDTDGTGEPCEKRGLLRRTCVRTRHVTLHRLLVRARDREREHAVREHCRRQRAQRVRIPVKIEEAPAICILCRGHDRPHPSIHAVRCHPQTNGNAGQDHAELQDVGPDHGRDAPNNGVENGNDTDGHDRQIE
jgi:hypothetical protein